MSIHYPKTRTESLVETIHNHEIPDPYRWMENLDTEEIRTWIETQNELTFSLLEQSPLRKSIQTRMTQLWDYDKYSPPFKRGGRYFYFYNDGLQNQAVLFWMEKLEDEPQVLIDPNTLSKDGTVALSGAAISDDGRYIAYGLSVAGSDLQSWHVSIVV